MHPEPRPRAALGAHTTRRIRMASFPRRGEGKKGDLRLSRNTLLLTDIQNYLLLRINQARTARALGWLLSGGP